MAKRWAIVLKDGKREVISEIYEGPYERDVPAGYRVIDAPNGSKVGMERIGQEWGFPKPPVAVKKPAVPAAA
jgi:hypothetical protein